MKRVRKYPKGTLNPFFEKWLEEWKQEAIQRDSPVQHSFGKALASLKAYPPTLERGKDCFILRGFGQKLCEMLDKKLDEQLKLKGLPPESGQSDLYRIEYGNGRKRKINADPEPNDGEERPDLPQEAKKRIKAAPKPYVPKVGSGAYALLIAMFMKSQEPGYRGFMLKKDLMSDAQELCDSPMKATAVEHYSGWSSMTTLIRKNYVIKVSNPAKYSLTDSGVALAMSLHESKLNDEAGPSCNDGTDQSLSDNIASTSKNHRDNAVASSSTSSGSRSVNHVQPKTLTNFEDIPNSSDDDDYESYDDFFREKTTAKTNNSAGNSSNETTKKQFNPDDYGRPLTDAEFDEFLKENIKPQTNTHDHGTAASPGGGLSVESSSPLKSSQEKSFEYFDDVGAGKSPVHLDVSINNSSPLEATKRDCKIFDDVIVLDDDDEDDDFPIQLKTDNIKTNESPGVPLEGSSQMDSKSYCDSAFDECPNEKVNLDETPQNMDSENKNGIESPVPGTSSSAEQKCNSQKTDDVIIIDDDDDDDDEFLKNEGIDLQKNFLDRVKDSCRMETSSSCGSEEEFQRFCEENKEPIVAVRKKPNPIVTELFEPSPLSSDIEGFQENVIESQVEIPNESSFTEDLRELGDQEMEDFIFSLQDKELVNDTERVEKHEHQKLRNAVPASQERQTVGEPVMTKKKREDKKDRDVMPASQGKKAVEEDSSAKSFILLPTNFDIVLLVDTQETSGSRTKPKDDATISELTKNKVMFEVRNLKVGDFTWVARCRFTNKELVLPYIIERKRIDDLAASILDGRYNEQKFRLRKSGLNNVIYLIENYGRTYHGALPITSLMQAAVNSTVQDEFVVKFTRDHRDSMKYLATLTSMLIKNYKDKELRSCKKKDLESPDPNLDEHSERLLEFSDFNKAAIKTRNYNVREMFIRQLVQLKGMSVDKAAAIVESYPTPTILAAACKEGNEKLIADIKAGPSKRKIGPAISKTIYQFYTNTNLS